MGLSSKQVSSSSGLDNWNQTLMEAQNLELPKPLPMKKQQHQQQNQQPESLKCPRCDSTNTKFCYYNNYNKSQPRHFCRACKRHWTKGGTLRNVPIGGGRKNKRMKKSTAPTTSSTTVATTTTTPIITSIGNNIDGGGLSSTHMAIQNLIPPPSLLLPQNLVKNTRNLESKDFGIGNGIFVSSTHLPPLPQNQSLLFPFSTSGSNFDTNPCSVSTSSLRSSNVYNYAEEFKTTEEPIISSVMPSSSGTNMQPWETPETTSGFCVWGLQSLGSAIGD